MQDKKWEEHCEFMDRSCDALVLAYSPNHALGHDFEKGFYIPYSYDVKEAFGYSLRKIFGQKVGACHWADAVKWPTIANLERLEKRVLDGAKEVICGSPGSLTTFDLYLSHLAGRFEHIWIYRKGNLHRFREGRRKEAIQKFRDYWNEQETARWGEIHKLMREHTKKDFEGKSGCI